MKKKFNKGFTLIELLVVIAIIGILASVILASLSSARAKGTDAATKSDLSNARAQAEIYYDIGNSYANVCNTAVTGSGIKDMMVDAATKLGLPATTTGYSITASSSANVVACHDNASAWAASVPLKATSTATVTAYYCVDSTGATKTVSATGTGPYITPLPAGQTWCS
jgi:prepilin-type N-terminal cleavage/methylation domain-containing protein